MLTLRWIDKEHCVLVWIWSTWKMQSKSKCLKGGLTLYYTCKRTTFWQLNTFTLMLLLCYLSTYLLERHWKPTKIEFYSPLQLIKLLLFTTTINAENTVIWCIQLLLDTQSLSWFLWNEANKGITTLFWTDAMVRNCLKERMQWRGLRWNPWLPN